MFETRYFPSKGPPDMEPETRLLSPPGQDNPRGRYYIGVADRCVVSRFRRAVAIGFVGFWEIDDTLPDGYSRIIRQVPGDTHLFKTEHGWHFVNLRVMSLAEKIRFRETMGQLGGRYPFFRENTLRISAKMGKRPEYAFTVFGNGRVTGNISSFHLRLYRPFFGNSYPFLRARCELVKTDGHLFFYNSDPYGAIETALRGER